MTTEKYIKDLDSDIRSVKKKAEQELINLGSAAATALIEQLKRYNTPRKEKRIHKLLVKMGNAAVQPLITELQEPDSELANDITHILGNMGDLTLEPLILLLKSKDRPSRLRSLKAIYYIDGPKVSPVLHELLDDQDIEIRTMVAEKLIEEDDEAALNTIIEVLSKQNVSICLNTVKKIDQLTDENVTEPFFKLMSKSDREIATEAAKALHRRNDPRAVDRFIEMLGSDERHYNSIAFAADILSQLGDERAIKPLVHSLRLNGPHFLLKKTVQRSLASFRSKKAVEIIIDSVKDEEPFVNKRICETLTMMPKTLTLPVLVNALETKNITIRYYAAKVLGMVENGSVKGVERYAASGVDVKVMIRSRPSVKALKKMANDTSEDIDVKNEAKKALKAIGL